MERLLIFLYFIYLFCTLSATANDKTNKKTQEYSIINEESQSFAAPSCSRFRLYSFYAPGNSPGVDSSYESVGAIYFGKLSPATFVPLLEVQQNFLNNGTWAPNVGVGSRYMNSRGNQVYGINFFYDGRNCRSLHFHQFGAGIEYLTQHFDFSLQRLHPSQ